MKTLTISLVTVFALLLACFAPPASAASNTPVVTQLANTTLSAAVNATQPYVLLASVTGVNGPGQPLSQGSLGTPSGAEWTILYVDSEAIRVTTLPSTGAPVLVERGFQSPAAAHASGAVVWIATPQQLIWGSQGVPSGTCTTATAVSPTINVHLGQFSECLNNVWVTGTGSVPYSHVQSPVVGAIAATSLTAGVAQTDTTMGCIEVDMPGNKLLTGIGLLNGATAQTDKLLVALYDSGGNLLANSSTAGVTSSGTSDYQFFPFATKYFAVGPALYYACMQNNGTTALVHMADAGTGADTLYAGAISSITFGTVPSTITVPTTFTTAVGPMVALY
jgi:hypothetical protein